MKNNTDWGNIEGENEELISRWEGIDLSSGDLDNLVRVVGLIDVEIVDYLPRHQRVGARQFKYRSQGYIHR
jgi:hypothetical protein